MLTLLPPGLDAMNGQYADMNKQLEQTQELIETLAKHNPEMAEQLRERCKAAAEQQHSHAQVRGVLVTCSLDTPPAGSSNRYAPASWYVALLL